MRTRLWNLFRLTVTSAALAIVAAAAGGHQVTTVLPPAGSSGQVVLIDGSGFAASNGKPKVYLTPGTAAKGPPRTPLVVTSFTDTRITAELRNVKKGSAAGAYDLHVEVGGQESVVLQGGFVLNTIELVSVEPKRAGPGDTITIQAADNGIAKGKCSIVDPSTGRRIKLKVTEWVPGTITAKLPKNLPPGNYDVSLSNTIGEDVLAAALGVGDVLGSEFMTFESDVYPPYAANDGFPQARVVESASSISQIAIAGQLKTSANGLDTRSVGFTLFYTGSLEEMTLPKTFASVPSGAGLFDGQHTSSVSDLAFLPGPVVQASVYYAHDVPAFSITITKIEGSAIEGAFSGRMDAEGDSVPAHLPQSITITDGAFRAVITTRQTAP